jgi:hypothetical protein
MNGRMSGHSNLTDCGLPGLKDIPYGAHMCHLYKGREDLAAVLVPYIAAGLRNNERCLWITAEPLDAAGAQAELGKAGLDAQAAMREGSLVIRDHSQWYAEAGALKGADLIALWLEEERRALAEGCSGLRITGNVTFLTPADWSLFMDYEETLDQAMAGHRIVALCSYRLGRSGASEVLDVAQRHVCMLERPDHGWRVLTTPQRQL